MTTKKNNSTNTKKENKSKEKKAKEEKPKSTLKIGKRSVAMGLRG